MSRNSKEPTDSDFPLPLKWGPETAVALVFLVLTGLGLFLRVSNLDVAPWGLDADQSKVLWWGHHVFNDGGWKVYATESTDFEALSSYLFAAGESLFGNYRVIPVILSLLDLVLFAWLLRRRGLPVDLIAAGVALMASAPIAFFYSRVAGPVSGVATLFLIFLLAKGMTARILAMTVGLFYYSMFRLIWLGQAAASLLKNRTPPGEPRNREGLLLLIPVAVLLATTALLDRRWIPSRGLYNFASAPSEIGQRFFEAMQIWFWAPSERWVHPNMDLIVDPVSQGFAKALESGTALGWGGSFLLVISLFQFFSDRFRQWKEEGNLKKVFEEIPPEILWAFILTGSLILSPTYSHAVLAVPLVIFTLIFAWRQVIQTWRPVRWALWMSVMIAVFLNLIQILGMKARIQERGWFDEVFADRIRAAIELNVNPDIQSTTPTVLISGTQYYQARYWFQHYWPGVPSGQRWMLLPAMSVDQAWPILSGAFRPGETVIVYFDIQELNLQWLNNPEMKEQALAQHQLEDRLRREKRDAAVTDIQHFGKPVLRRYQMVW